VTGAAFLAILAGVAVLVLVIWIVARLVRSYRARIDAAWSASAAELGVNFIPGSWRTHSRIHGSVEGVPVEVRVVTESSGESSSSWTVYTASYPALGLGLSVRSTRGWQRIGRLFGAKDIETGDAAFDPEVTVKGDDPERVRAFLTPARRMSVHRLLAEYDRARIEDDQVRWRKSGVEKEPDRIVTTVRRLAAVAQRLTGRGSRRIDAALEARAVGEPGRSAELLAAEPGESASVEDRLDEAEAAYADGRFDQAADVLENVARALPADEQVAAWRRRSEERRAPMALPAETDAPALEDAGPWPTSSLHPGCSLSRLRPSSRSGSRGGGCAGPAP
jgi:hypothetical protein